jgi:integrase
MALLGEILAVWMEDAKRRVDIQPSTKVIYMRCGNSLHRWGHELALPGLDLDAYAAVRVEAGVSARTLRLEFRVLSVAFHWARRRGIVPVSVRLALPRIRLDPNVFVANHRTPTSSEAGRVIGSLPPDDWRLALLLLARTGARVGEVVSLRACDFDAAAGTVAFGAVIGASKSGKRWFPLDERSVSELSGRTCAGTEPLLDFGGVNGKIQSLHRRLRAACRATGVPAFTPHGLRRMVVSRLLRAGVDAGTAATLTGHSVPVMLKYYQQVSDEDRRAAVGLANLGMLGTDAPPDAIPGRPRDGPR